MSPCLNCQPESSSVFSRANEPGASMSIEIKTKNLRMAQNLAVNCSEGKCNVGALTERRHVNHAGVSP
jgi:hypothetical protein